MTAVRSELDPRDDVLRVLAANLRGPRRVRAELLTELRDGLDDATVALEDSGLDADRARQQAVDEFGDPVLLARELQTELIGVQARRTALAVAVGAPILEFAWGWGYPELMREYWIRGGRPSTLPVLGQLSTIQQVAVWTVAPLLLLAYGSMLRRKVPLGRANLAIGLLAGGLLVSNVITSALMTALNPELIAALEVHPAAQVLPVVSMTAMLFLLLSAARTVRLLVFAHQR
jgi:hypothetical protein